MHGNTDEDSWRDCIQVMQVRSLQLKVIDLSSLLQLQVSFRVTMCRTESHADNLTDILNVILYSNNDKNDIDTSILSVVGETQKNERISNILPQMA